MRIVVTGCNGRVGSRCVLAALNGGHEVLALDTGATARDDVTWKVHPKVQYESADLRDFARVLELFKGYDAVINLAGIPNPTDYLVEAHNTNVVISWNVLRAAAELGMKRAAMASSVNAVTMVYSKAPKFEYFPLDEKHPTRPDEPYGLSKLIGEMQADSIVQRFPDLRVASIRLHWSLPYPRPARKLEPQNAKNDLWGWVQQDSVADAFLRCITLPDGTFKGHEVFYIAAPEIANPALDSKKLREEFWPDVPIKEGWDVSGATGFFDCTKAKEILGWVHTYTPSPEDDEDADDSKWG